MAKLQLIIDAMNNSSEALAAVKKDIEGVGEAAGKINDESAKADPAGGGLGSFLQSILEVAGPVGIGLGIAAEAAVKLYKAGEGASGLDYLKMQLDNVTASVGTTANVMINDLTTATGGFIEQADLVAGAVYGINTGVIETYGDAETLAVIAKDMGMSFVDTISAVTGTSAALGKLGVDVTGVKTRVAELVEETGVDKSTASIIANTEALQQHIEKTGSVADSARADYIKTSVALENIEERFNGAAAGGGNFLASLTANAAGVVDSTLRMGELKNELQETGQWTQQFQQRYEAATGALGIVTNWEAYNTLLGDMGVTLDGVGVSEVSLMDANQVLVRDIFNSSGTWEQFKSNASLAGADLGMMTEAAYYAQKSIGDLNATPLEDKEATAKMEIDTSEVDNYDPEDKYATVHYSPGGGGGMQYREAVGGAVYGGEPYTWQEYGYKGELFVPSSNGFVMSRADAERALSKALTGGGAAGLDAESIGKAVAKALSGVTMGKQGGNTYYSLTMPTSNNPADVRTAFELMEAWA